MKLYRKSLGLVFGTYMSLCNTFSCFAADAKKVNYIDNYVENRGAEMPTDFHGSILRGKAKRFKIRGSLKEGEGFIGVDVMRVYAQGKKSIMFYHRYDKTDKNIAFVVYELPSAENLFDGKVDCAVLIRGASGSPEFVEILPGDKDMELFQNAHDISVDRIYEQIKEK